MSPVYAVVIQLTKNLLKNAGVNALIFRWLHICFCLVKIYDFGHLTTVKKPVITPATPTCFRHALDVARQQQAKSWELRAAMSLSRLWQRQGKQADAHALLAPIYG
jgi:hypothetical protein